MDTKSLAKSKRAHTLHHKKHHPNQKVVKAAAATAGGKVDPSNWDRYENEDDHKNQQPSDVVVPKTKGADYAFLISEAKAQNSTRLSSEDFFPTLDDDFDFGQGKESFVSVRGESLLSSIQNDSFFVQDKTPAANYEASFLSLNMHALAKQLTKIDLPKRLFMETDFFPPMQQRSEEHQLYEVTSSSTTKRNFDTNPTLHQQPMPKIKPKYVSDQSKLKAETTEIELDTLLDDVKLKASSKKTILDFDIDSTLDDLLNETSSSTPSQKNISSQTQHVSKPEPLDDFDSWLDTI